MHSLGGAARRVPAHLEQHVPEHQEGGAAAADDGGAQDEAARQGRQLVQAGGQPRLQQDAPGQ